MILIKESVVDYATSVHYINRQSSFSDRSSISRVKGVAMKFYPSTRFFLVAVLFAACCRSAFAQGTNWTIDTIHTQATFQVKHLWMSNIRGGLSNITGSVVWDPKDVFKDTVHATLDAKTINTGSDYRDKYYRWALISCLPATRVTRPSHPVTPVGSRSPSRKRALTLF